MRANIFHAAKKFDKKKENIEDSNIEESPIKPKSKQKLSIKKPKKPKKAKR